MGTTTGPSRASPSQGAAEPSQQSFPSLTWVSPSPRGGGCQEGSREPSARGSRGESSSPWLPAAPAGSHSSPRTSTQGQGTAQQPQQRLIREGCLCNSHLPGSFPAPACMFCQPWKQQMLAPALLDSGLPDSWHRGFPAPRGSQNSPEPRGTAGRGKASAETRAGVGICFSWHTENLQCRVFLSPFI